MTPPPCGAVNKTRPERRLALSIHTISHRYALFCLACLTFLTTFVAIPIYTSDVRLQIEHFRAPKQKFMVVFIVLQTQIDALVNNLGPAWFNAVSSHSDVYFLIGDKRARISRYQRRSGVYLLHVKSEDRAYPPLNKTAAMYADVGSLFPTGLPYEWMLIADSDTYVRPETMNTLAQGRDYRVPHYLGRPLHHCQCSQGYKAGDECPYESGVNYCSGMGYLVSRGAFEHMRGSWDEAKQVFFQDKIAQRCSSSDTFVGWAMGQRGILCSPALPIQGKQLWSPPSGVSWGAPNSSGVKQAHQTSFCQNRHHQGGVVDTGNIGKTYLFEARDFKQCLLIHPLKNAAQFRYVQFAMSQSHHAHQSLLVPRVSEQCLVGIGVFAVGTKPVPRDAIRVTWKRLAETLPGLHVMFLIGRSNELTPDHVEFALHREAAIHGDILELDMVDSYDALYTKSVKFFEWGVKHTDCKYLFKTDDDSYLRALPLVNFISKIEQTDQLFPRRYFGKQWGVHGGPLSPVIKDPTSPWFGYDKYPHEFYPPFMSGSGYGLSRDLARDVVKASSLHPSYRCEDAGVGILVDHVRRSADVKFYTDPNYFGTSCREDIVIDNPAFHDDFNMYHMFSRDLAGHFCIPGSAKAGYLGGRSKASDQVYAHPAKFLEPPKSPWTRSSQTMTLHSTWSLVHNMSKIHAESTIVSMSALAKDKLQQAVKDVDRRAAVTFPGCFTSAMQKTIRTCLDCSWSYAEVAVQYKCRVNNRPRLILATATYAAGAIAAPVSIGIVDERRAMAILVHFSGDYDAFNAFIRRVGRPFMTYTTTMAKKIMVTCSGCAGDFEMQIVTREFEASGDGSVAIQIVDWLGPVKSRPPSPSSIAIFIRDNIDILPQFFDNVATFVRAGESVYFPVANEDVTGHRKGSVHTPDAFAASVGDLRAIGHLTRGISQQKHARTILLRFRKTKIYVWRIYDPAVMHTNGGGMQTGALT